VNNADILYERIAPCPPQLLPQPQSQATAAVPIPVGREAKRRKLSPETVPSPHRTSLGTPEDMEDLEMQFRESMEMFGSPEGTYALDFQGFECCDLFRKGVTLKQVVPDSSVRKSLSDEELQEAIEKIRNYESISGMEDNFLPFCGGLRHWNHRDGVVVVKGKKIHWRLYNTRGYDSRRGIPDSLCISMLPFV